MSTVINEYVNNYYLIESGNLFITEYRLEHKYPNAFRGKIKLIGEEQFYHFNLHTMSLDMIQISLNYLGYLRIIWTEQPKLHFLCVTYNFGKPIDSIVRNTNWLQEGF